ncbi:MAG: hypothetical protein ACRDQ0_00035 [Pseudonocardia sp.]
MTAQTDTPTAQPIAYHWVATIQTAGGVIATDDGSIDAVPGVHTHTSTYRAVQACIAKTRGTEDYVLLFFSLTPDRL